ncbi:hypothetical protein [Halohasta litorea]|uniref:Uncharacterized protein n=1 Tax=Halohasta litorea TaxID=869891 RepID=A0ABD6D4G5_9EURY|nr:hypothetical protein [Halohasta litorea]
MQCLLISGPTQAAYGSIVALAVLSGCTAVPGGSVANGIGDA